MTFLTKWPMHMGIISCALMSLLGVASCISDASETDASSTAPTAVPQPAPQETPLETETSNRQLLAQGQVLPVTAEVELGGRIIGLEVARTPQQQAIGLMARETLSDDRGMLFPFDPPRPVSFWMKNVLIPLDMVFIYNDEIVAIARDVPPCETTPCPTYGPADQPVKYVLELRGGLAADLDLQVGQTVQIEEIEASGISQSSAATD